MSVFKRTGQSVYSYDFRLDGRRYSGSTGHTDLEGARAFERHMKDEIPHVSAFGRQIIRKIARGLGPRTPSRHGYVYMLRAGCFIKIGHAREPDERIKAITTASPLECELLFCIPGKTQVERQFHREFAACHHQREWFFFCGKLKAFIEELTKDDAGEGAHLGAKNAA